uniref:Uncharacterized protein n=1 Tax=Arundo donax TaxID=35708 RepID=A0A0A8ZXB3_ARUDO
MTHMLSITPHKHINLVMVFCDISS